MDEMSKINKHKNISIFCSTVMFICAVIGLIVSIASPDETQQQSTQSKQLSTTQVDSIFYELDEDIQVFTNGSFGRCLHTFLASKDKQNPTELMINYNPKNKYYKFIVPHSANYDVAFTLSDTAMATFISYLNTVVQYDTTINIDGKNRLSGQELGSIKNVNILCKSPYQIPKLNVTYVYDKDSYIRLYSDGETMKPVDITYSVKEINLLIEELTSDKYINIAKQYYNKIKQFN